MMDKEIFSEKITDKDFECWNCPKCIRGRLKLDKKNIKSIELTSPAQEKVNSFDESKTKLKVSGFLKCDYCGEIVNFIALRVITSYRYQIACDKWEFEEEDIYYPKFFYPAIHPFRINKYVPEEINKEIEISFYLLWVDEKSCANKIRSVLEMILNQQKIKKQHRKRSKTYKYSLHERIELFAKKKGEISSYIMALKHIGNAGSHGKNLTRNVILEAYEFLEFVLNKLYDKQYQDRRRRMLEINRKKKP